MAFTKKNVLRDLTEEERKFLERGSRSSSEPAGRVARSKVLLALADGMSMVNAARAGGRSTRWGVVKLIKRFNERGLSSLEARHGGGPSIKYGPAEKERILKEFHRDPDLEKDGTKIWSLTTLQRALRTAEDGLPEVSTAVILDTLHQAGMSWQQSRTWCQTGEETRKRMSTLLPANGWTLFGTRAVEKQTALLFLWFERRRQRYAITPALF